MTEMAGNEEELKNKSAGTVEATAARDSAAEMEETILEENTIEEAIEEEMSEADEIAEEIQENQAINGKKEGKSFFKKRKDKKDEKIEELNDKLMRLMAEFDNYRKRTDKEKSQMFEIGAKDIVEKILPVVDNFERGLMAANDEEKNSAFVLGIEKIYKQLLTSLESAGVKPIDAVGKEFNPNFHNAVMHAEDEELGESIVTEEFQKGYMYRDSVVRHSMVKVVN